MPTPLRPVSLVTIASSTFSRRARTCLSSSPRARTALSVLGAAALAACGGNGSVDPGVDSAGPGGAASGGTGQGGAQAKGGAHAKGGASGALSVGGASAGGGPPAKGGASGATGPGGGGGSGGASTGGANAGGGSQAGKGGSATGGQAGATAGGSSGAAGGASCKANDVLCDGTTAVKTCKADGSGYVTLGCPTGTACDAGVCKCGPVGASKCEGMKIVTCGADGQLHDGVTCPTGTTCLDGLCDDIRCADETSGTISVALPTTGWPRYRHDNRSSGWTHAVVADAPKLKWKVLIGGTAQLNANGQGLAAGPVVNQNNIVFLSGGDADGKGGHFYALDGKMGASVYEFAGVTGYGYTTPAVRADGTAYYSTADGHAYAVSPTGVQQWAYSFGFQNDCSPIVTKDGFVIYGSDNASLFALKSDGALLWQSDAATGPGETDSALAESCDGLIYAGGAHGFTGLDAKTGVAAWKVATTGAVTSLMSSPTVAADGTMYGIDSGGIGYAIDKTGKVLWQKEIGPAGAATDFARIGTTLYAVLNDGALHALDGTNGAPLWSKPVGNSPEMYRHGGPVVDGRMRLYFSSNDGSVYAFDATGNALYKLTASGIATPGGNSYGTMAIGKDGTLYVPGNDGYLYAFQ